tara:strand:- start:81 stop:335 length:255 start_codon:yes stop_codon:yes gene_type:complete
MALNKLVRINSDTYVFHDKGIDEPEFDPDKTIYDLKIKSITVGEFAICIENESESFNSMILYEGELFWIATDSLDSIDLSPDFK